MFKKTLFLGLLLSAFAVLPFTSAQVSAATTPAAKEDSTLAWWGYRGGWGGWGGYRGWGGYGYGGYRPYYGYGYGYPSYGYGGYGYGCSNRYCY